MKITTFLSVNNENLGAIARMSNGTYICIVYKGVQVAPKQGFQKYVWVTIVLRSTLEIWKCQLLLAFSYLLAEKISCSAEFSMKKVL